MGIQIISYRCNLKNRMGHIISSSIVKDVLLDPKDHRSPLKGLSKGLEGIKKGEIREVSLRAHEAYGLYDPKLVVTRAIDESEIEQPFHLHEQVLMVKDGRRTTMRVVQCSSNSVTLDGNHPLAGQDLVFEIHAIDLREATEEELCDTVLDQRLLH